MSECIAVAMSGGVDSSVTAGLLKEQGYEVIGITLRLWEEEPACKVERNIHACCSLDSVNDAKAVADVLGIRHYTLDFRDVFRHDVIDYFIDSYAHGKTPNPCIACNRFIKFGLLWDQAQQFGADLLATGHYARIVYDNERKIYTLRRGKDERKDQSYVLYQLTQDLLKHIIFPMADLEKTKTRELAKEWGLPVFNKPESQDICFIPDNDYKGFLKKEAPYIFKTGRFTDGQGRTVGTHKGIAAYTIGQRRGLNLGGPGGPYYVVSLDEKNNEVRVGSERELFSAEIKAHDVTWTETVREEPFKAYGKIRYAAQAAPCTVYPAGNEMKVVFDKPQRAATAGQALVLYEDDRVLGGGTIT